LQLKKNLSLLVIHGFAPLPEGALDSFDEKDRENFEELLNTMRTKTLYFFMQEWVITDALLAILADIKNELKVVFSEEAEIIPDESGQLGGSGTSLKRLVFYLTAFFMLVAASEGTDPTDSAKTSTSRSADTDTDPSVVVPLHFSESMLTSSRLETPVAPIYKQSFPAMINYIQTTQSTDTKVYTNLFPDTSQLSTYQKWTTKESYISPKAVEDLVDYLNFNLTKSYNDQQALCKQKIFFLASLGLLQTFEYNPDEISKFLQKLKKENTPDVYNAYFKYFDWFKKDKTNVHNNQTGVEVVTRQSAATRLFEEVCNNFPRVEIISEQDYRGKYLKIVRPQNMAAIRYVFEVLSLNVMFSQKFEEHPDLNLQMEQLDKSARVAHRKMSIGYITYMQRYFDEMDQLASKIENVVDEMEKSAKPVYRDGLRRRELTFSGAENAFMTVLYSLENVMKLNLDLTVYKDPTMVSINKEHADYLEQKTFITNEITEAIKKLHKAEIEFQLSGITPYFSMAYEWGSGFMDMFFNNLWAASGMMAVFVLSYAVFFSGALPTFVGSSLRTITEYSDAWKDTVFLPFLNYFKAYMEAKTQQLREQKPAQHPQIGNQPQQEKHQQLVNGTAEGQGNGQSSRQGVREGVRETVEGRGRFYYLPSPANVK
jgi:hypothetical protein